jgi:hypothetical protein
VARCAWACSHHWYALPAAIRAPLADALAHGTLESPEGIQAEKAAREWMWSNAR